jgi:hypothetical protein
MLQYLARFQKRNLRIFFSEVFPMGDIWLVLVVTSAICGTVGYLFATKTGKNRVLWVMLGVVFNVFGLALLSMVNSRRKRPAA